MKYKYLSDKDIKEMNLSDDRAKELEQSISLAIERGSKCNKCNCSGFEVGNPTTKCRKCGHSVQSHM
ncbi:hypothetical protein GCM10007391_33580 [Alteromonas halophila]|uniref:Uncharacterized protein n=1 Tax=Alteromonas halophila TaxID=516698 RepID=A0A918N135_9ALTE|nr:hypothetical protein GCM10007391_33580 [Alteromonas halophila]